MEPRSGPGFETAPAHFLGEMIAAWRYNIPEGQTERAVTNARPKSPNGNVAIDAPRQG